MKIICVQLKVPSNDGLFVAVFAPIVSIALWFGFGVSTQIILWGYVAQLHIAGTIFAGALCHAVGIDARRGWRPRLLLACAIALAWYGVYLLLMYDAFTGQCCGDGAYLDR
ncbi:hypothetical protein [Paraburkholderia youngii]|uniref:hypothetical protein n=1 Tax=Paraburkholderia youngii TaxID=2782701 RepID=UPI003D22AB37